MAKQLNVALDFTANTTQAKQQIQELQQLLTKIANGTGLDVNSTQIKEASEAARQLAIHLNEAYNQKTGNYDLSRLNASLNKAGTNVTELSTKLINAGTTGRQAFITLAQSIAMADQPMITLNARLQDFLVTVKNSVKWQISSSMIHQIIGAVQRAYGYAQDLNESLNNIRIVTGHNIDYMDKFADKANKAAKALSTSTLNYTNASLIYYQQGLSDQEVEDRTAVTIKMANAAGESAEKISDQLTAVWNNFYDGTQSLEYYADVMTALGAATASSTDEISAGLEKFAAVSNSVGLSYEYATSALATVTATTRQSADVVGTAFKTLFARIQDLELGKTLDDGTTLGKYSQALETVGVSIKTADGGLREMDDILSDLGEKWNSFDAEGNPLISDDAKVALAQTVAGVRQYTQLIALMDNWDFMKENLETARNATGTLNKQQKIYEESWEAANKRLKASFQSLYQDLIDDKFFIKFTDFLTSIVDGIDIFIDKVGGVKPLLIGILSIIGQMLSSKIQPAIDTAINNIRVLVGGADKVYAKISKETINNINSQKKAHPDFTPIQNQELENAQELLGVKNKLAVVADKLSTTEKRYYENDIQFIEKQQQETLELIKLREQLNKDTNPVDLNVSNKFYDYGTNYYNKLQANKTKYSQLKNKQNLSEKQRQNASEEFNAATNDLQFFKNNKLDVQEQSANQLAQTIEKLTKAYKDFIKVGNESNQTILQGQDLYSLSIQGLTTLGQKFVDLNGNINFDTIYTSIDMLLAPIDEATKSSEIFKTTLDDLYAALDGGDLATVQTAFNNLAKTLEGVSINGKDAADILEQMGRSTSQSMKGVKEEVQEQGKELKQYGKTAQDAAEAQEGLNKAIQNFKPVHHIPFTEAITSLASACGSAAMAVSSLKSTFDTLSDPDIDGWEKFTSLLFSLSMLVPSIISIFSGFSRAVNFVKQTTAAYKRELIASMAVESADTIVKGNNTAAASIQTKAIKDNTKAVNENTLAKIANIEVSNGGLSSLNNLLSGVSNALPAAGEAVGEVGEATERAVSGWAAWGAKITSWIKTALPVLKILGAFTAAFSVVALTVGDLIKQDKERQEEAHKYRNALVEIEEPLEELKNGYNQVSNAISEVNSKISGLENSYNTIDQLKKGTGEWRDTILQVNEQVQDVLKQYNLLADGKGKYWFYDSNGAMHITEEAQNKIATIQAKEQAKATSALGASNYTLDTAKNRATKEQFLEDWKPKNATYTTKQGVTVQTSKGRAGVTEENLEKILNGYEKLGTLDLTDKDSLLKIGVDKDTADLISGNSEKSQELRESIQALKTSIDNAEEAYRQNIVNSLMMDPNIDLGENGENIDPNYHNAIYQEIADDIASYVQSNAGTINAENYKDEYASTFGYKKGEDGKWYNTDENGNIDKSSEIELNNEAIQNWVAEQQAREIYSQNISERYTPQVQESQEVWTAADNLKESWNAEDSAASQYFKLQQQGAPEDENSEEYKQYQTDLNSAQENLSKYLQDNAKELSTMFNMSEDGFKEWISNSENVTENADLISEAINGNEDAVNKLRNKLGVLNSVSEDALDDIRISWGENKKAIEDYLEAADSYTETSEEYKKFKTYLDDNADSFSTLAGVSKETFNKMTTNSKAYATKAGQLIQKALEGDLTALRQLRAESAKEIVLNTSGYQNAITDVKEQMDQLSSYISNFSINNNLEIGATVDNADFLAACQTMVAAAGMTAEQAQEYFKALGYSAEIDTETKHSETQKYYKWPLYDDPQHPETITGWDEETVTLTTDQEVPTIKSLTYDGGSFGGDTFGPTNSQLDTGKNQNGDSSGGEYTPPPKKEYKDEIERYHVIKQKIEDLEEVMEHLAKAKERAFGTSKLELMDQEIEKYNEMIDLQNQYLDEINKYWEEDKALIASYGAEFDETGVITNYDEIMKRQIDKYNSSIGKNEEADEAAEEAYDDFIEALEQYEETNNLRQDELEKLYDLQTELADVIFEKTQYKIEIKIAVKDDELEYLDYLLSKIEDDAYSAAEAIALIGEKAENALEKTKTYSDGLMELLNNHGINSIEELDKLTVDDLKAKNFTEDEIGQIREWRSSILEANQELLEMRATIQEKVLDSFNQFSEDVQDQIDLFEHYQNILEGVKDITSLLGAQLNEQSKLVLRNLNRSLMNNSINNIAGAKQQVETLKQMRANAQEQYDKAIANEDSIGIKQWSDTLKEIDDQVHSAEENFLDTWQEALERARDIFEEEMDNIVKEFEDGVSPIYGSIEALQDAITRANELNDQYLSDTDKTYELNKLRRQIEGSVDDTDIIPHKQALNKLQDELNKKLKDGSKISEYDLKILQSKYELELARQKLEDVQNSNETVRLTRDNNGNWGYVYSANEDKIAEAEQEYEDKLNAYQKANEEYLKTLENNIIQLQSDYQEKLTAIRLSFVEGEISQAEYEKQAADLEKYYNERMQQIHQQYEEVFKNSKDANEKFVAYYKDSSGALVENFNQTTLALQTGYQTLDEMFEKFWKSHDNYVADSNKLLDDYLNKIKEINSTAGIEGSFADAASGWSIKITGESDKAVADMEKIVKNATDSFNDVIKAASDWESIYVSKIDSAIKRNEALVKTMNEMVAALSGMNNIDYSKYENAIDSRSTATANNIISTQHNSESFNKTVEVPDYISQFSYLDMLDQLDMNKQIEDWMSNNELSIDTALMDSLDISTILQNIGLNVQTIVSYLSNLIPSSLGVDRIAQEFMQQVSINADFPNVTDSNEIMEAFEIMENEASQYANRKTI